MPSCLSSTWQGAVWGSGLPKAQMCADAASPCTTDEDGDCTVVFFAQAPRGITENDIRALFSSFGRVKAVKCFRYAHSPRIRPASRAAAILPGDARRVSFGDTKGSGLVKMASAREAAAAIRGLDGIFKFTSATEPLVVRLKGREGISRRPSLDAASCCSDGRSLPAEGASTNAKAPAVAPSTAPAAPAPTGCPSQSWAAAYGGKSQPSGVGDSAAASIMRALMQPLEALPMQQQQQPQQQALLSSDAFIAQWPEPKGPTTPSPDLKASPLSVVQEHALNALPMGNRAMHNSTATMIRPASSCSAASSSSGGSGSSLVDLVSQGSIGCGVSALGNVQVTEAPNFGLAASADLGHVPCWHVVGAAGSLRGAAAAAGISQSMGPEFSHIVPMSAPLSSSCVPLIDDAVTCSDVCMAASANAFGWQQQQGYPGRQDGTFSLLVTAGANGQAAAPAQQQFDSFSHCKAGGWPQQAPNPQPSSPPGSSRKTVAVIPYSATRCFQAMSGRGSSFQAAASTVGAGSSRASTCGQRLLHQVAAPPLQPIASSALVANPVTGTAPAAAVVSAVNVAPLTAACAQLPLLPVSSAAVMQPQPTVHFAVPGSCTVMQPAPSATLMAAQQLIAPATEQGCFPGSSAFPAACGLSCTAAHRAPIIMVMPGIGAGWPLVGGYA